MKKRITALALAIFMVLGTVALAAGTEKSIAVSPMTLNINGQTAKLRTTTKRYVPVSRRSRSMKSSYKLGTKTI